MPYSSVSEVPSYVPAAKREQWMKVFNSAYARAKKDGKSAKEAESFAFRNANGVVRKAAVDLVADVVKGAFMAIAKAKMTRRSINDLPDSAFAYIEPGGKKDESGKTIPRSKRHFPVHDKPHAKNALQRAKQSPFGQKAMPKILAACRRFGVKVSKSEDGSVDVVERKGLFKQFIGVCQDVLKADIYDPATDSVKPHKVHTESEHQSKEVSDRDEDAKSSKSISVVESKSTFKREVLIKSVDKREWIVYGVVMEPTAKGELKDGKFIGKVEKTDTDGHFTTEEEVRKAMIQFMEDLAIQKFEPHNVQHKDNQRPQTAIIENWQAVEDFEMNGEKIVKGSWVQGTKIYDEDLRAQIEKGEITGYSIEGSGYLSDAA